MQIKKLLVTLILLFLAGVSPNFFIAAQSGMASFSSLVVQFLFPSVFSSIKTN
jgi:hypothetical protein